MGDKDNDDHGMEYSEPNDEFDHRSDSGSQHEFNQPLTATLVLDIIQEANYSKSDLTYLLEAIHKKLTEEYPSDIEDISGSTSDNSPVLYDASGKRKIRTSIKEGGSQTKVIKTDPTNLDNYTPTTNITKSKPSIENISITNLTPTQELSQNQNPNKSDSQNSLQPQHIIPNVIVIEPNPELSPNSNPDKSNPKEKLNPPPTNNFKDKNKPPDIVVRGNQKWNELRKSLASNGIEYKTVSSSSAGLKIRTPTIEQYHKTLKLLASSSRQYHTFLPEEERNLQVVIRGSGMELSNEEAMEELKFQGFNPIKVNRMRHPRTHKEMPLLLVSLPRDEDSKGIYNIQFLCEIPITVEPLKPSPVIGQCHRCLLFGHSANRCTASYRCKHCSGDHNSTDCPSPYKPYKCANCGLDHRATYRGCKRAPQNKRIIPQSQPNPISSKSNNNATPPDMNSFPPIRGANTMTKHPTASKPIKSTQNTKPTASQIVGRRNNQMAIPNNQLDIAAALNQFQNALVTLSGMFTNLSRLFSQNNN